MRARADIESVLCWKSLREITECFEFTADFGVLAFCVVVLGPTVRDGKDWMNSEQSHGWIPARQRYA
jgi:hypothetical protein